MPTAKKLPSGNYRCRVYSHTDASGKKHYESFTASTKQQAEMLAAKFAAQNERQRAEDLTVKEAVDNYISANTGTLSPSTIDGYIKDKKCFEPINHLRIRKLTSNDIQRFITSLSDKGLSPKTVKNRYGLLRTALTFSGVDTRFTIHLPTEAKKLKYAPENEQITALYKAAPHKMKVAIMLAAFHSLRRGEISGLKYKDLKGNTLHIHSDVVKGPDKQWIHKETPKTSTSNRIIYLSDEDVELIGQGNPEDYIVPLKPGSIGTNFYNLCKRMEIEGVRFHDLRVYFASISALRGIPEVVTAHHGGWKEGSKVLSDHYRKPIETIDKEYADKLNDFFRSQLQ